MRSKLACCRSKTEFAAPHRPRSCCRPASCPLPTPTAPRPLACLQAGRLLPYADYKAGPFTGLTVCFSGLSANSKTTLAALVVSPLAFRRRETQQAAAAPAPALACWPTAHAALSQPVPMLWRPGVQIRNGGQHSPALDKKCTHLVTNSTDSEKYR